MNDIYYYAWVNDFPKKKFKVVKNKKLFMNKLIDYAIKILGSNIKQISTDKKDILILTNGIDIIEFKEETGIEDICKIDKAKLMKRIEKEKSKELWETDIGRHILKNMQ